ncbi:hypothetical protein Q3G72_030066 [Acer saccharum]|nr:hypothetical protein Q3G72_030066 [Acer saccharum]
MIIGPDDQTDYHIAHHIVKVHQKYKEALSPRPRGFGFITFDSEDAVDRVLHKTFHELMGKRVEVKPALTKYANSGGGSHQDKTSLTHTSKVRFMAQSPDGCTVASAAAGNTLRIWNSFGDPKVAKSAPKAAREPFAHFNSIRLLEKRMLMRMTCCSSRLVQHALSLLVLAQYISA